jgi:competence protein ComEC
LRRPSVAITGAFIAGLVLSGRLPLTVWWSAAIPLGVVTVLMTLIHRRGVAFGLFLAGIFLAGCLRSPEAPWVRGPSGSGVSASSGAPCIIRVERTTLFPVVGETVKAKVDSVIMGPACLRGSRVLVAGTGVGHALSGGTSVAAGTFYPPRPRLNPYGRDGNARYRREGLTGVVVAGSWDGSHRPGSAVQEVRRRIGDLIDSAGGGPATGVLEALLLGERAGLDPAVGDVMKRAGTYHVIAISGLHVGIIVMLVTSLITAAGPPRGARIALAVAGVAAYVVFTGARPSAQRAGAFFALLSLLRYLQWKTDLANCASAAGFVLLAIFPHLAWDVGFRLSLAAVFGITLLVPELEPAGGVATTLGARVARYVRLGMLASLSAQAASLPVLLYHFGRVSLMGVMANLVILPMVTLAVAAGMEASVLAPFLHRPALVLMKGAHAVVALMIWTTSLSTRWIDPVFFCGRPSVLKIIIYVVGVGYVGLFNHGLKPRRKLAALLVLAAYLASGSSAGGREAVLTFIHVGDGDACLIRLPGGRTAMVDTGPGLGHDAARLDILPLLAMEGIKRVDTVIVTHSHDDHYGGLPALADNIRIRRVLVGTLSGEAGYVEALEACRGKGIEVAAIGRGDTLRLGRALLEFLHPDGPVEKRLAEDANELSIVFRLTYGKARILFTADITPQVQRSMAARGDDLACHIMKVPHHGAPGGVDPSFAAACGAPYGVISVGSRFASHPSPATIDLLEKSGMRVLVTRSDGAVTVVTDGESLEVRSEAGGEPGHILLTSPPAVDNLPSEATG